MVRVAWCTLSFTWKRASVHLNSSLHFYSSSSHVLPHLLRVVSNRLNSLYLLSRENPQVFNGLLLYYVLSLLFVFFFFLFSRFFCCSFVAMKAPLFNSTSAGFHGFFFRKFIGREFLKSSRLRYRRTRHFFCFNKIFTHIKAIEVFPMMNARFCKQKNPQAASVIENERV